MNTPINHLTAGFIGLGLIGGSIARGLKRSAPDIRIMAYMRTREKLEQAHADGIVDLILDGVDEHLSECDIIFLCTPVEFNESYLRQIRPFLKEGAVVTDVGSTKTSIHETVAALGMESCFVGGHPMAGSEKTGYESSTDHLLENAYYIITPTPHTPASHTDRMVDVAKAIGALPLVLDYHRHDFIVAAISHLPHLIASSLVNLVHDCDSAYTLAFLDADTQAMADSLNELKADAFDGDEEEDYYDDDKKDYDKDASFILNGKLQQIAEHRLAMARSKGYGSSRIPDEGTLDDYLKSIGESTARRHTEIYLINCDDVTQAEEKLLRNHDSDEKKRVDRVIYYKEMGVAHQQVGDKHYYMIILMR